MELLYTDPTQRLRGEGRSKLLDPKSDLYAWLQARYEELQERERGAAQQLLVDRAQLMHGTRVSPENVGRLGRAWVLFTGQCEGYGKTHVTVAFFPGGVPKEL